MNTAIRSEVPPLALRLREAAQALSVSERTLYSWTKKGLIPYVRQGKTILYPTAALARWLDEQASMISTVEEREVRND